MSIINSFFDKIYVISMTKNTERHDYIKSLFTDMKIYNYSFIFGPEGENINPKELYNQNKITQNMISLPNPIGTIETHKMAWLDIINNNYEKCLIFEDDVFFFNNFENNLTVFLNNLTNLKNEWSILQIGWLPPSYSNPKDKKINDYVKLRWSGVGGSHCYGISLQASKTLVENMYPINKAVDGYIGDMTNPWTKEKKNIYLYCYSPVKCLAIDCSHNLGNTIKFKSHGIA